MSDAVVVSLGGQRSRVWPFVPKPNRGACLPALGVPDLGTAVHQRQLAFIVVGGGCYFLGLLGPLTSHLLNLLSARRRGPVEPVRDRSAVRVTSAAAPRAV